MIVIVLVFAVYALFFTNFDLSFNSKNSTVNLKNLKTHLLNNYTFTDKLKLVCIDEGEECFVFLDGKYSKENQINHLFNEKPEVYKYSSALDLVTYDRVTFKNQEDYEVCFEFVINKDRKTSEMIVLSSEKVFVFSSLSDTPIVLAYLNDVTDMFEERISEVKDAF